MKMNTRVVPGFDISGLPRKVTDALTKAITAHAYDVLAEANQSIQKGPKTGVIYKRRGVTHQASAPGEAPASDTGALVASGRVDPAHVTRYTVAASVTWGVPYAGWLEKGHVTVNGQHVAPRPYARPAILKLQEKGRERVRDALKEAMQ